MPVPPAMTEEQELAALKEQAEFFSGTLDNLRKRIEEIQARVGAP